MHSIRPALRRLSAVAVLMGILAIPSTAIASGTPIVTHETATDVTSTEATLHGTVNPNGLATKYTFYYTTNWMKFTQAGEAEVPIGSGTSPVKVNAVALGLSANTTYHFFISASNSAGYNSFSSRKLKTSPVTLINGTTKAALGVGDPIYGKIGSLNITTSVNEVTCPPGEFSALVQTNQQPTALVPQAGYVSWTNSGKCITGGGGVQWLTLTNNSFVFGGEKPIQLFAETEANFDTKFTYLYFGSDECHTVGSGNEKWKSPSGQPAVLEFEQQLNPTNPSGSCWPMKMKGSLTLTTSGGAPVEIK